MQTPTFSPLSYTYKKTDSDVWVLNTNDIPVDQAKIAELEEETCVC